MSKLLNNVTGKNVSDTESEKGNKWFDLTVLNLRKYLFNYQKSWLKYFFILFLIFWNY